MQHAALQWRPSNTKYTEQHMNSDLHLYVSAVVLAMVLVQTLFHFRKETRSLIIAGTGKAIASALDCGNRLLHVMLMTPKNARPGATGNDTK